MLALAIADRDPRPGEITAALKSAPVDIILCLGDLNAQPLYELHAFTGPKLGVYGNHCLPGYLDRLGVREMHLRRERFHDVLFGGFNGCLAYKPVGDFQYSEGQADSLLSEYPPVDVMLCHSPPAGVNDTLAEGRADEDPVHRGLHALADYVRRTHPKVLLHGHTHPTGELTTEFEGTRIAYVHGCALVDLLDGSLVRNIPVPGPGERPPPLNPQASEPEPQTWEQVAATYGAPDGADGLR